MICLGIESTAHTFGAGIVDNNKRFLANIRDSYSTKSGGIIPSNAAQHHVEVCDEVIKKALSTAGLAMDDIDVIAFSQGPGIGHALRIGAMAARALSLSKKIPIVGVNHCIAHLEIGHALFDVNDPVLMYVSGANTQIIAYEGKKFRVFGETLDIGIGNFLDSFARELGLGFPGGPKIYEMALNGKNYVELPYVVKGMDVSFGGLLTNLKQKVKSGGYDIHDLCYSVQETTFAMLLEVTERAIFHCDKKELILGGGVACNKRLQEMSRILCKENRTAVYIPEPQYLVDNAAMIAWLGLVMYKAGYRTKFNDSGIRPYERTDDVEVVWRK